VSHDDPHRQPIATQLGLRYATEERTAAGIHGVIVSAAVMAASHAHSAVALIVSVLVSLGIYWGAERYARILAERVHVGHRVTWPRLRQQLTSGWEMVLASGLPLVVLASLRLLGAELYVAVFAALSASTFLLCLAAWETGRRGMLTSVERLVSTAVAGLLGLALILLKATLH
jgi:hypothetical protein